MESGYHSGSWFELDRLFARPERLRPFVVELARRLGTHGIDAVCGPVVGGARLAGDVAAELGVGGFTAERFVMPAASGLFPVRYLVPAEQRRALQGCRVAIVDDAISAGSAVRGTHADLLGCGAVPVALGALFVLGDMAGRFAADHGLVLEGIVRQEFGLWKPS